MMVIDNQFEIGEIVFLKTDPDQGERIITGITIRPTGIIYIISRGQQETTHYDIEITKDKNVLVQ